jgi:hypothetical protein
MAQIPLIVSLRQERHAPARSTQEVEDLMSPAVVIEKTFHRLIRSALAIPVRTTLGPI